MIALIHDILVTIGALLLANYEFDLTIIAALLTIVGYSVNDTVIVCDRIRENMRKIRRESLESIINTSINETLSRTIITVEHCDYGVGGALSSRRRGHSALRFRAAGGVFLGRLFNYLHC